jgi:trans-aconitate 2-methyltransferase
MPSWNPNQYLEFNDERTQPCRDLVARIALKDPAPIVDLGCGPGNSTQVLMERWPAAKILGLDSSPDMIAKARQTYPAGEWATADIATWSAPEPFDLVFSNAALQWVPGHETLYPRLLEQVVPGGALAVQVPFNMGAPAHEGMRELAASPEWRGHFPTAVREWYVNQPGSYYDWLSPHSRRVDLWTTEYLHVLAGPEAIVEWYKGTGLRPFLDLLPDPADRERFLSDYLKLVTRDYPRQANGRVLFPFHRLFLIAYR